MADFDQAIPFVLLHEGGYVNDPNDHGGATNWGISLRYLIGAGGLAKHPDLDLNHDGLLDYKDIKLLTKEAVEAVYKADWWVAGHYGDFTDQPLANKVFDMAINMGPPRAHRLLQSALCACGKPVAVDGNLGPKSIQAANQSDPAGLMHVLCALQADFYRRIVQNDPKQDKFLKGWIRRSQWTGS